MGNGTEVPWEPPLHGTASEHLLGALDRLRMTFRWKVGGLGAAGLRVRVGASALTLGGLLKHLAFVEDVYSTVELTGEPPGQPWEEIDWDTDPDWPWHSATEDTPDALYTLFDSAVERSRARLRGALTHGGGLEQLVATDTDNGPVSMRRLVCELIEEYGRHAGHADLIRESVGGLVGEDPPPDWRP